MASALRQAVLAVLAALLWLQLAFAPPRQKKAGREAGREAGRKVPVPPPLLLPQQVLLSSPTIFPLQVAMPVPCCPTQLLWRRWQEPLRPMEYEAQTMQTGSDAVCPRV